MYEQKISINPNPVFSIYRCSECSYRTPFFRYLNNHIKTHTKTFENDKFRCELITVTPYKCEFCDYETNLKVDLLDHITQAHDQKANYFKYQIRSFTCDSCTFESFSLLVFHSHQLYKKKRKWYEHDQGSFQTRNEICCNCCPFGSNQKKKLDTHTNPNVNKYHHCVHCLYKTKLRIHLKHPHLELIKYRWFLCNQCKFKSRRQDVLKRHQLNNLHITSMKTNQWYICDQCSFNSKWRNVFCQHMNLHTSKKTKWYKCGQCSYKSQCKGVLKSHIQFYHVNKWHKSEEYSYKSTTKRALKSHRKNRRKKTEDHSWYQCGICLYKCTQKHILTCHMKNFHQVLENYECYRCAHCSFMTKQAIDMQFHMRKSH